jgi:hypothetical protein
MNSGFDFSELVKKAIKYLCEGLIRNCKLRDSRRIEARYGGSYYYRSAAATFAGRVLPASVPVQERASRFGVNWRNKVGLTPAHYSITKTPYNRVN